MIHPIVRFVIGAFLDLNEKSPTGYHLIIRGLPLKQQRKARLPLWGGRLRK